ncbi:transporter substrate-binding domain-containing protein, partial [Desulfuromonas sp. TF]|uniref:transporter substrate-binding domain-containing protein n=1 Tax=Desulfuromonas sp. TF TaxID=1232410 RepID=UPI0005540331
MPRPVLVAAVFLLFISTVSPCTAGELADIKQKGELSFAMTGQYPPFNFVDENNRLTGFDVEICTA